MSIIDERDRHMRQYGDEEKKVRPGVMKKMVLMAYGSKIHLSYEDGWAIGLRGVSEFDRCHGCHQLPGAFREGVGWR